MLEKAIQWKTNSRNHKRLIAKANLKKKKNVYGDKKNHKVEMQITRIFAYVREKIIPDKIILMNQLGKDNLMGKRYKIKNQFLKDDTSITNKYM